MIHSALDFLSRILNDHLKAITESTADHVFLTNISDGSGIAIPDKSIGVSLVSIEEERVLKDQLTAYVNQEGTVERRTPEIRLNLYMMISANFQNQDALDPTDDYIEGLKQLSYVLGFFQAHTVFTPDKFPMMVSLDPLLQKLVLEFYSSSFEQMYNFWSILGTHYLPSVMYKIRMIRIQEQVVDAIEPPIENILIESGHR